MMLNKLSILLAFSLLLLGCEPGSPGSSSCSPQSCPGCCDATGQCQTGTAITACGTSGGVCLSCPTGQKCELGRCIPNDPCASCTGCCQNNQCLPGSDNGACGLNGRVCVMCGSDEVCSNGTCISNVAPTQCNPSNCAGCCSGGTCVTNVTAQQCGANGTPCRACQASQECKYGACSDAGCSECAAQNGCCKDNRCYRGNSPSACGFGGAACTSCEAGGRCVSGRCEKDSVQTCDWESCWGGCCRDDGSCQIPFNDQACGIAGQTCDKCSPYERCDLGSCKRQELGGISCGITTCSPGKCCKYGLYCVEATECAGGDCNCTPGGTGGYCNPPCGYNQCCGQYGRCEYVGSVQCPTCSNGTCFGGGTYCAQPCYGNQGCLNGSCQPCGPSNPQCPSCPNGICVGGNTSYCQYDCRPSGQCCSFGNCVYPGPNNYQCQTCNNGVCNTGGSGSGFCDPGSYSINQCCNAYSNSPVVSSDPSCNGCDTSISRSRVCNSARNSGTFVRVCVQLVEINCSQTQECYDDWTGSNAIELEVKISSGQHKGWYTDYLEFPMPNHSNGQYRVPLNKCGLITQFARISQQGLTIEITDYPAHSPITTCTLHGLNYGTNYRNCDGIVPSITVDLQRF